MKFFFDTNILAYIYDRDSRGKREQAIRLFDEHVGAGNLLLSTQVLQEFYVVVTRKFARPLEASIATEAVINFAKLPLVQIDTQIILAAIRRSWSNQFSFWDALIVEAAIEGKATTLYSEDMQNGLVVENLRVVNPLA